MKKGLGLAVALIVFTLSSCTNYTHKKIIKNDTREMIEIVSGCCGEEKRFTIEPGSSEVVFSCIYQQIKPPVKSEMTWDFLVIKDDGSEIQLDIDSDWLNASQGKSVEYIFEVE